MVDENDSRYIDKALFVMSIIEISYSQKQPCFGVSFLLARWRATNTLGQQLIKNNNKSIKIRPVPLCPIVQQPGVGLLDQGQL